MIEFVFVRHAESLSNQGGRLSTRPPGPDLSEEGAAHADAIAAELAGLPVRAVFSSTHLRAVRTAEPIAGAHRLTVQQVPSLAELSVGELEGLPADEGMAVLDIAWRSWVRDGRLDVASAAGGERASDVLARFDLFLAHVRAGVPDGGLVAVVGHGGYLQLCLPVRCANLADDHGYVHWLRNGQQVRIADDGAELRCLSWAAEPVPGAAERSG